MNLCLSLRGSTEYSVGSIQIHPDSQGLSSTMVSSGDETQTWPPLQPDLPVVWEAKAAS